MCIPEDKFWRTTPRKLYALLDAHIKANDPEQGKKQPARQDKKEKIKRIMNW